MRITFLGTSAAPSMPIPFCVCAACTEARRIRGKNLRRRSSVLVNGDLLVDIGPDIATAASQHDLALTDVRVCLLTHSHGDHFDPEFIMCRDPDYGTVVPRDLVIAGSEETLEEIDTILKGRCAYGSVFDPETQSGLRLRPVCLEPFEQHELGAYRITPFPADHGPGRAALVYSIQDGGHALFYGADTSGLSERVWQHLRDDGREFDVVILDQTYGVGLDSRPKDHMAASAVAAHAERFRKSGLLKSNAMVYATHISHEGCLEHDQLDAHAEQNGYRIAYDGLVLELDG